MSSGAVTKLFMAIVAHIGLGLMILIVLRIVFLGHETVGAVLGLLTGALIAQTVLHLW